MKEREREREMKEREKKIEEEKKDYDQRMEGEKEWSSFSAWSIYHWEKESKEWKKER